MAAVYASVAEVEAVRGSSLSAAEITKAGILLGQVSAEIRVRGEKYGVDVDAKAQESEDYMEVVKSVCINTVNRAISQAAGTEGMSQMSQTALGYTLQGTFANPGNSYYISKNDLLRLGFGKQQFRGRDIYGVEGDNDNP